MKTFRRGRLRSHGVLAVRHGTAVGSPGTTFPHIPTPAVFKASPSHARRQERARHRWLPSRSRKLLSQIQSESLSETGQHLVHHDAPWGKFTWLFSNSNLHRWQVFVSMVWSGLCGVGVEVLRIVVVTFHTRKPKSAKKNILVPTSHDTTPKRPGCRPASRSSRLTGDVTALPLFEYSVVTRAVSPQPRDRWNPPPGVVFRFRRFGRRVDTRRALPACHPWTPP